MAGPCRICGARGPFGFRPPGIKAQRKANWIAWACADHRAEVEAQWLAYTRPNSPRSSPAQSKDRVGEAVSQEARDTGQGELF